MHLVVRVADLASNAGREPLTIPLIDGSEGSVHMASELCELPAGESQRRHLHPHEEALLVLGGRIVLELDGRPYELAEADFGVVPIGTPHAIRAVSDGARWLSVRAPQPTGTAVDTIVLSGDEAPARGQLPDFGSPMTRLLGHFDAAQLPPPGEQQQAGYHGGGVAGVSIRMMVDGQLGANHLHMFVVQFEPGGAGEIHDHPYEESYLLVEGEAEAVLEGKRYQVSAGDIVWTSVGASHGFFNRSDAPVRWIETQTPQPPRQHGHRFLADWESLLEQHRSLQG